MMNKEKLGVYLHIPFCLRKCCYCDFCSQESTPLQREAYVQVLYKQILSFDLCDASVDTVFFGGGTPSLLTPTQIGRLLEAVQARFGMTDDCECSMEANPATVTVKSAAGYRAAGINRVSIGVQSMQDRELLLLGRLHTAKEASDTVAMLCRGGICNINIDLMYGIPDQTVASFGDSLAKTVELAPTHISAYALTLEEGTPLYRRQASYRFPDEDAVGDMYDMMTDLLRTKGYMHYEISNFAREGFACRHNLRYWQRRDYAGFGVAAHSCLANKRLANTSSVQEFMQGLQCFYTVEELSQEQADAEKLMLGLRLAEGVSENFYRALCDHTHDAFLHDCIKAGYMTLQEGRLALTDRGMYVSNEILATLVPLLPQETAK